MRLGTLLLCLVLILTHTNSTHATQTIVVDFSEALLTLSHNGDVVLQTPVVLPRADYYPVPVSGTVRTARMWPVWVPTATMHRDYPGRYKRRYGPGERGNAMGHCKLTIDFESTHPLMPFVRIHGNAKSHDLGKRRSRSCIRIPDVQCPMLVETIRGHDSPTLVYFIQ